MNNNACHSRIIHKERVKNASKTALPLVETENLGHLFKAMADTTRLRILWALSYEEMCVCDLAAFLNITESAVSHQLRLLRQLHLVSSRRDGPVLYYRLNDEHVNQLITVALDHIRE